MEKVLYISVNAYDVHADLVLSLSNRLIKDGIDCCIDQYINGFPEQGWQRWMNTEIEKADFVLMACTPKYLDRYKGLEKNQGKGVNYESIIISQTLYERYYCNEKFIPIIFEKSHFDSVPKELKIFNTYLLPYDYEQLYRKITRQPEIEKPKLGNIRKLIKRKPNNNQPSHYTKELIALISRKKISLMSKGEIEKVFKLINEIENKEYRSAATNIAWLIVYYEENSSRTKSKIMILEERNRRTDIEKLDSDLKKIFSKIEYNSINTKILLELI